MPQQNNNSTISLIAIVFSLLLAAAVGYYILFGSETPTPEPTTTGQPVAVATDDPAATPTPEPTSTATPTTTPTPTPIPTPEIRIASIGGSVEDSSGELLPEITVFVIERTTDTLEVMAQKALADPERHWLAETDALGFFELEVPAPAHYLAGFYFGGEPQPFVQDLGILENGESVEATFIVPAPREVSGLVLDQDNNPAAGIPVTVRARSRSLLSSNTEPQEQTVVSDASGQFTARVFEPTTVVLSTDPATYPEPFLGDPQSVELGAEAFDPLTAIRPRLRVQRGEEITGRVVAGETAPNHGEPIAGAKVTLTRAEALPGARPEVVAESTSDSTGAFTISRLHPGLYALNAEADGFDRTILLDMEVPTGEPLNVELAPLAALSVELLLPEGKPLRGAAQVALMTRNGHRELSGNDPTFVFDNVMSGAYLLAAIMETGGETYYAEKWIRVPPLATARNEELLLRTLRDVEGTIVSGRAGDAAGELFLRAENLSSESADATGVWSSPDWRLNPKGRAGGGAFVVQNLIEGDEYLILASATEDGPVLGSGHVTGRQRDPVEIALGGVGTIRGRLTSSLGSACPGEEVSLTSGIGVLEGRPGSVQKRTTRTRFDGTFEFAAVPAGSVRVVLQNAPEEGRLVNLPADETLDLSLGCRSYVNVSFRLTSAPDSPIAGTEQFLILPQPGTVVRQAVTEISYRKPEVALEPGSYTITRTATMESASFTVVARVHGQIAIHFGDTTQN